VNYSDSEPKKKVPIAIHAPACMYIHTTTQITDFVKKTNFVNK